MKKLLMFLIFTLYLQICATEIADVFSDNMILQRNSDIAVWENLRTIISLPV